MANSYKLLDRIKAATTGVIKRGEVFIVDMSSYSGDIDHKQLFPYVTGELQPQIHGAIVRATDGTYIDPQVYDNYAGFREMLELPVGVYGVHYPRATATANKNQAFKFIEVLNNLGEYPALWGWGDWERNPDKLNISTTRWAIWKYIQTVQDATGRVLPAYTNAWWDSNVANDTNGYTDIPKDRPLWAASWYATSPYICHDWRHRYPDYDLRTWVLWQYENRYRFPGVPGSVDASTFNGSLTAFYRYFKLEGAPPEPPPEPEPGEPEMKYKVTQAGAGLRIRSTPLIRSDNIVGSRNVGDIVIPLDTTGDVSRYNSYWVLDERGWSAAQWYGEEYLEPFV